MNRLKIIIVGERAVGKTSIKIQYIEKNIMKITLQQLEMI